MALGDFVKELVALLHKEKINIPFEDESPWHELFYELKKYPERAESFAFFENLQFDWDGPYPKCQELSDFLHALHWNASVSAQNPSFDSITLIDDIAELWMKRVDELADEEKKFLYKALVEAKHKFVAQRA
jgi:hypothetical protein